MGQKVRPTGFRVGIMEDWRSRWYASKHEFADLLVEDFKIRAFIKKKYGFSGIPKIEIERTRDAVTVLLSTARPGVIIGRKGAEVKTCKKSCKNRPAGASRSKSSRWRGPRSTRN
jgi:small subunit ribosomal protein S3